MVLDPTCHAIIEKIFRRSKNRYTKAQVEELWRLARYKQDEQEKAKKLAAKQPSDSGSASDPPSGRTKPPKDGGQRTGR